MLTKAEPVLKTEKEKRLAAHEIEHRTGHPYHMYDSILLQPTMVREALAANEKNVGKVAGALAKKKRLYLVGIGTSSHAAIAGEYFFRVLCGGKLDAQFIQAFEFVHYPPRLDRETAVLIVSHRGWKTFSEQATKMAREQGALSISVTGRNPQREVILGEHVLFTSEQEKSHAHTMSSTAALAVLLQLAQATGKRVGAKQQETFELSNLPDLLEASLALEPQTRNLAGRLCDCERFFFVAFGPSVATALEAALKMQETTFTASAGYEVEQFLHGPLASVSPESAVFFIAPPGLGQKRCWQALNAVKAVGAKTVLLTQKNEISLAPAADETILLPEMNELVTPIVYVVPVQLYSYFTAIKLGHNADVNHRDDLRYQKASEAFAL